MIKVSTAILKRNMYKRMTVQIFTSKKSAAKIIHQMPLKRNEMAFWRNEMGFWDSHFCRGSAKMGVLFNK